MPTKQRDTIVAATTPKGRGGVAIVRVSGPQVPQLIQHWWPDVALKARLMHLGCITTQAGEVIDEGLWVFFQGPHSYTGEDVLEFQGHGNPVLVDAIVEVCCQLGCRMAGPGEFTERAFLNDRMNLAQAEAVADLIAAESRQQADMAMASLQGAFSDQVHALAAQMLHMRTMLEASLDFSDEDLDGMLPKDMSALLKDLLASLEALKARVEVGVVCQEGLQVTLVGPPNVGKSSLFNALSGLDQAIVTPYAGTTRDLLHSSVQLFGMSLRLTDTAGLREVDEPIEQEGIERAKKAALSGAHKVLVLDASKHSEEDAKTFCQDFLDCTLTDPSLHVVLNKGDLIEKAPAWLAKYNGYVVSAKTQEGLMDWGQDLANAFARQTAQGEGAFLARRRHLVLLEQTYALVQEAEDRWAEHGALELLAEDLKEAHEVLGGITGKVSSDDVLGEIFSTFCIGK